MASPPAVCKVCMKLVLDTEEGIACESGCGRWFHRACVNISKSEYTLLAKDSNKKWYCSRVDCKPHTQDPLVILTTSVNKLMEKIESWSDKIEKISEVSAGIGEIKSDIGQIKEQLSNLEPRVTANEVKIENLISEVKSLKTTKPNDCESVIKEVNDRSQRALNAIIYGIPESTSNNVHSRIEHDKNSVNAILHSSNIDNVQVVKVTRLGKQLSEKPRPLRVTFANSMEVSGFFKRFNVDSVKDIFADSAIGISRDRTVMERSHLKELRVTLDDRKKAGESDITIKYLNGVPRIVKQSKN